MKSKQRRMNAHSNMYLAGNIIASLLLWMGPALLILDTGMFVMLKVIVLIVVYFIGSAIEHQYLTGVVARIVERLFPSESATAEMECARKYRDESQKNT
jgi:hypothetical protein